MLSISTLQIQSVKNVIKNDRTLPKTNTTKGKNNEIRNEIDLQAAGYFYTRLANPTTNTNAAEEKITALEGGVATNNVYCFRSICGFLCDVEYFRSR